MKIFRVYKNQGKEISDIISSGKVVNDGIFTAKSAQSKSDSPILFSNHNGPAFQFSKYCFSASNGLFLFGTSMPKMEAGMPKIKAGMPKTGGYLLSEKIIVLINDETFENGGQQVK